MADLNESNEMEGGSESGGGEEVLQRKARRIIALFSQIVECLEETEMSDMNDILLEIFEVSKKEDSNETSKKLMQLYCSFLDIVKFHSGISVTLIDQALRSFRMIAIDALGLGNLVSGKYMEMILLEYPSLSIDMKLTPELLRTYLRLLKKGYEEVCHIRLMVVGMYEVGKSTLVRNLCNQPSDDVESTEGIDILTNSCEINYDGDWEISTKDERKRFYQERLQVLVNKYGQRENSGTGDASALPTEYNVADNVALIYQRVTHDEEEVDEDEEEVIPRQVIEKKNYANTSIVRDLLKADKEKKISKRKPTVSIWDFAGQSVYYSTHHFFLNARSIYLLVLDLSKELTDKVDEKDCKEFNKNLILRTKTGCLTCHDTFKFWMRSIYIYTEQKQKEQGRTYKPTIILIGTHKDMLNDKILKGKSLDQYKEDYFSRALECFEGRPVLNLVHYKKFLVAKNGRYEDFLDIKKEIYNVASKSEFWKEKVPANFITLEKAVQEKKDLKANVMSLESIKKANDDLDLPEPEIQDIELFLTLQHAFGNVLHYNHEQLGKMIILNPQWIIDIFKIFVTHKQNKLPKDVSKWNDFERYGKLDRALISSLFEDNGLYDAKEDAVKYMEYLNVMVRPVDITNRNRASDSKSQKKDAVYFFQDYYPNKQTVTDFYIMPCMLPPPPEGDNLMTLFTESGTEQPPTLCMYIKKGFLPPFVFHCIVATCIKELPISQRRSQQLLCSCLSEFQLENTTNLLIWFVDDFLNLSVIFKNPMEVDSKKVECCKDVKKRFERLVLHAFNIHGKDTFNDSNKLELFEYFVECPLCSKQIPFQRNTQPTNYMNGLLRVKNMDTTNSMCCSNCGKMVTKEQILGYWFDIEHQQEDLYASCPTEAMLADFAEYIGDEISDLGSKLLLTEEQMSHIKCDYREDQKTIIYHVLYYWKQRNESLTILHNAMKESGCKLENFDRIVTGKETEQTKKAIRSWMAGLDETKFVYDDKKWDSVVIELVECVGSVYWLLGIRLNIRETALQREKGLSKEEQIRNILNRWRKLNKRLEDLIKAMVKSNCDMVEVKKTLMKAYSK